MSATETATPEAAVDEPRACELLTALVRLERLIDAQPTGTLAADDIHDQLDRLREAIDAAHRAAQPIRDAGAQVGRACPSDMRQATRFRLELDLIHDVDPEELLAVLLARIELSLDGDDVDVADVTTTWERRQIGGGD